MKLFDAPLAVPPPLPAPPTPATVPEPARAVAPRKGRPASPTPDERLTGFAKWMADTNRSSLTIGSYCAAVSATLRRGVAPDAHETAIASLELSPASHALYLRAWRNWLRYIGAATLPEQAQRARRAATLLCQHAKGRKKPTLGDLKTIPWSSLAIHMVDGAQHFSLSNGEDQWFWERTDERAASLTALLELAHGGPLPLDDAAYERALEAISNTMVYA